FLQRRNSSTPASTSCNSERNLSCWASCSITFHREQQLYHTHRFSDIDQQVEYPAPAARIDMQGSEAGVRTERVSLIRKSFIAGQSYDSSSPHNFDSSKHPFLPQQPSKEKIPADCAKCVRHHIKNLKLPVHSKNRLQKLYHNSNHRTEDDAS